MKHVTIIADSPEHSAEILPSREVDTLENITSLPEASRLHHDDEGDRTPRAENYEKHHLSGNGHNKENNMAVLSKNSSHLRLPHTPTTPNSLPRSSIIGYRHSANASTISVGERLLEKLQWRERIRHYTWTFFTMTMATGGIANVLYEGKKASISRYRRAAY